MHPRRPQAPYQATGANFGPAPTKQALAGDFALVNDGSANPTLACNPLVDFPAGSIALIDRGACNFTALTDDTFDDIDPDRYNDIPEAG